MMLTVIGAAGSRAVHTKSESNLHTLRQHNDPASERARLIEALSDLYSLLEEYAPAWYTEEHHRKAESALGRV